MSIASKLASNITPIKSDLVWETMDVSTLSKDMQAMFAQLLRAQEAERNARKALTDAITTTLELPPHLGVRIGAKWGKLSVAIAPITSLSTSTAKPAMSLSDLVAKANRIA